MKPIIFSTESIQAIQDRRKTQTRRVIKKATKPFCLGICTSVTGANQAYVGRVGFSLWPEGGEITYIKLPYQPGDILWVRETWKVDATNLIDDAYVYRADYGTDRLETWPNNLLRWRSPIYMPRAAARIFLRVTDVKVERVQDITDADAIAEGCMGIVYDDGDIVIPPWQDYTEVWDKHNAKRNGGMYAWAKNPWVEVTEFERIEKPEAVANGG